MVLDSMESAMDSVNNMVKFFLILVLSFGLTSGYYLYADPELHTDETQNTADSQNEETDVISAEFNASTGSEDTAEDSALIDVIKVKQNDTAVGGYVTTLDGKAIMVDGRPILQEKLEDGRARFAVNEDQNGVRGFCDNLANQCIPSNLNQFTYKDPNEVPIILITYNQHLYETEGIGSSSYEEGGNNAPEIIEPEISLDLTQNEPGTTTPSIREECKSAAQSGSALPSLSRGCIDAANQYLNKPIPLECASDFIGPKMPGQDQTCSKHSEVRKSAEAHLFLDGEPDSKAKKTDEKKENESTDQDESKSLSKDEAEEAAETVGNDADEALDKVEESSRATSDEELNQREVQQEDSANADSVVDESVGVEIDSLNPAAVSDEPAEVSDSTTPADIQLLYGDDEGVSSDEDDSMDDNVNDEEPLSGGFISNNSDWFNDDGTLTDPDDFENRAADEDEFSDMEDLLGLKDLGKDAAKEELDKPIEVKQETASPSTGDVSLDAETSSKDNEDLDVESLKINLNAADKDVDVKKQELSRVNDKTGVKIVKTEDGFIAETFSLKENSEADGQNSEVKLISKMDKEELMNRFNLSEDELDKKLQECKEANPKAKNSDCLKEDATLFGDLLIKQD